MTATTTATGIDQSLDGTVATIESGRVKGRETGREIGIGIAIDETTALAARLIALAVRTLVWGRTGLTVRQPMAAVMRPKQRATGKKESESFC